MEALNSQTTEPLKSQTLTINGLPFVATPDGVCEFHNLTRYTLTSVRGVKYWTMRNDLRKDMMFVLKEGSCSSYLKGVWLQEKPDGTLSVLKR